MNASVNTEFEFTVWTLLLSCYCLQLEEEEAKDSFDVDVAVTNPEKVGQCVFIIAP